jgi:Tfp pilus assembly PilM family ATPase
VSRFIAIDVDAGGLFVVAGFAKGNSVRIEQAVPVLDDPRPLTPESAPDLAARLKAALAEARVAPAPALVCVGRDRAVFKDIRHPKTAPADEPRVVRFQAERDLAESPDSLLLDYVPLPAPAGADDRRATAVFVRKELYNAARTLCEQAGLKLAGFTPVPYAAAAAVRRAIAAGTVPPPENPAAPVASLCLWDGGGLFVVTHGEHMVFSRSVSGMALQSEAALVGEAKRSLAAYASQNPRERLDAVYLSEGHGTGGSWAARLQEALPLPVHPLDPLAGTAAADALPPHLRGRFTAAVGLLAARGVGPLPINFVTPRQPRAEPSKKRSWALLALLLVLVLGAGAFGGHYWLNSQLDKREQMAKRKATEADGEIKAEQLNANKVKAVEEFRGREVNCLDLFYDITTATTNIDRVRLREYDVALKEPKVETGKSPAAAAQPGKPAVPGAKPGTPATKAAAAEPVGKVQLVYLANSEADDDLVKQLVDHLFAQENKFYGRTDWKNQQSSKRDITLTTDLLPRKPDEFSRKLKAEFPKPPQPGAAVPPPPAAGEDQP